MIAAARHYTKNADKCGCMITEALQGDDEQACALAAEQAKEPRDQIRNYIAAHAPTSDVDRITDYLLLNLRGLSAYARLGYTQKKLIDCARTAGRAFVGEFSG